MAVHTITSQDSKPINMVSEPLVYELYGLRVYSKIALPAPVSQSSVPLYDIEVRWDGSQAPPDPPAGRLLARLDLGDGRGYLLTQAATGYTLRFHRTCEFWIRDDLHAIRVHLFADVHADMAALLFVGNVLACMLTLAGECVLHASAVEIGNSALAFVGGSGMGKSTLAALLCASGARFIADDLLRLQPDGKGFRCFPGTGQIRLRKDAVALAESFSATVPETTPDGRIVVRMDDSRSMPPLGAIVIPYPSHRCKELKLQRLRRPMALLYLIAFSRMQKLQQEKYLQSRLDSFGCIAASIPIFKAEIPWGPPFPPEVATALVQGVGLKMPEEVLL